jgi:hypothetical protein
VNAKGVVGVTWYDRREDQHNKNHRLRFTASLDGGVTWLASEPVSTAAFEYPAVPRYPAEVVSEHSGEGRDIDELHVWPGPRLYDAWNSGMGDYAGFAAGADGRFHAFWIDNRTGVAQMYSAAVEVQGTAVRSGAVDLAALHDVTPVMGLGATHAVWDPVARTIALTVRVKNMSIDTIVGPLKMRITKIYSDLGPATLILPPGAPLRVGAVLDLTPLLPSAGLAPGAWSESRQLEARIDSLQGVLHGDSRREMFLIDAKFYAARGARPERDKH